MWFHHLIWEGFNGPTNVPCEQLRAAVPDFEKLVAAVSKIEADAFVKMKMQHLAEYKVLVAKKKKWYEGLKAGGQDLKNAFSETWEILFPTCIAITFDVLCWCKLYSIIKLDLHSSLSTR